MSALPVFEVGKRNVVVLIVTHGQLPGAVGLFDQALCQIGCVIGLCASRVGPGLEFSAQGVALAGFDLAFAVGVFDGVGGAILAIEQVGIVPRAAPKRIFSLAAGERVVSGPAFEVVRAVVARQRVVPRAAVETVAVAAATDFFGLGAAEDDLVVAGRGAVAVDGQGEARCLVGEVPVAIHPDGVVFGIVGFVFLVVAQFPGEHGRPVLQVSFAHRPLAGSFVV